MSTQMRYPREVKQDPSNGAEWENLNHVLIDDWESLASCQLSQNEKPNSFIVSDFKFNIPAECKIHAIDIRLDYHRDSSQNSIELDPPLI
ncbi:MAG: ABC transporter ATP-binding protein, partial [Methanobrevibacter sp.]|nr:ABC transporter ATP-binding protein [Methanobrevibacter sp.]